jgi:hypothetical protein
MIVASACMFKREETSEWEEGIVILTNPGLYDAVGIFPKNATTPADIIQHVWKYELTSQYGAFVLSNFLG